MKAKGSLLALICAAAVLSAMPATASGTTDRAAEVKVSTFEVRGSNGYEVTVSSWREGDTPGDAVVQAVNGPLQAIYSVPAGTAPGIHAIFGSLGQLDVSFEQRRKEIDRVGKGCRSITEEGVFRGTFRFVGENGYFSSEAANPEGEIWRLPDGFCIFENFRRARPFLGLEKKALEARTTSEGREISFQASKDELRGFPSFEATIGERIDQMKIMRTARVHGGKQTFSSTGRSRASVSPPPPFSGSARFRDPARQPATWTGSLTVPFPGVPNIALAGEGFIAKLCPRISILSRCLKSR
jgi:hypothetical protein